MGCLRGFAAVGAANAARNEANGRSRVPPIVDVLEKIEFAPARRLSTATYEFLSPRACCPGLAHRKSK